MEVTIIAGCGSSWLTCSWSWVWTGSGRSTYLGEWVVRGGTSFDVVDHLLVFVFLAVVCSGLHLLEEVVGHLELVVVVVGVVDDVVVLVGVVVVGVLDVGVHVLDGDVVLLQAGGDVQA